MNVHFIREVGVTKWLVRKSVREFSKRVLKRDNFLRLPTGLPIWLPKENHFSSDLFVTNCNIDWGAESVLSKYLEKDGVFLDIGAHMGYYSLYMLPLVNAVYAFEPDPRARAWLTRNLSPYANAMIIPVAVGGHSGRATYVLSSDPETSHLSSGVVREGNVQEVDIVTIDEFVARFNLRVTAMKIDVEGFDFDVVVGALQTLRNQAPLVLTEAKPEERLFEVISIMGYRVFAFTRDWKIMRTTFEELHPHTAANTKMLFLVPGRLEHEFLQRVAAPG